MTATADVVSLDHHRAESPRRALVPQLDEASRFTPADTAFLASRGLVYLTSLCLDPACGRMGTIIASSYVQALELAAKRGCGETILGRMAEGYPCTSHCYPIRVDHD